MTKEELHKILDDDNKKISLSEFRDILYVLKRDCFCESGLVSATQDKYKMGFYDGEINAFYLALDLSEHIKE